MSKTYYGCYRTRTFADIFPTLEAFKETYEQAELGGLTFVEGDVPLLKTVWLLLYSRYGNSHISYSDENQFRFGVCSRIFQYGPAWEKRLEAQRAMTAMTEEEIRLGGEATYNSALNPSNAPSTGTRESVGYINSQNKTLYTKTKLEGYANLLALLETDVTEDFLVKFRDLFIRVLAPDEPLLYATYPSDYDISED